MEILSYSGFIFLMRWVHFLAGVMWIGLLYYFNVVQGPFLAGVQEAATKKDVTTKLLPRALWWFRWGAMFTVIVGLILYFDKWMNASALQTRGGLLITIGGIFGIIMWFNVWFIIWPNQQKIIAAAEQGKGPTELGGNPRIAFLASRTNTMLSIPMLFCMAAASHMPW